MSDAIRMHRRRLLGGLAAAAVCAVSPVLRAGSYLDRAALLIAQGTREIEYVRRRFADKELCRVVHELCRGRVETATRMLVPQEVVQAHPHLLLVLEHHEQAAAAAEKRQAERFLVYRQRAIDEERVLRGILKQLGWSLPDA